MDLGFPMDDLVAEGLWEIRKVLGSFLRNAHYNSRFIEDDSGEFNMMGVKNWTDELRRFVFEAEDLQDEIETSGFMSLKTKKIKTEFSFDIEDMSRLSCHRNTGDHHWKLLSLWKELSRKESLRQKEPIKYVGPEVWQVKGGSVFHNTSICDDPEYAKQVVDEVFANMEMLEHFNQEMCLGSKTACSHFCASFGLSDPCIKDLASIKSLAYDGWFIKRYTIELESYHDELCDHVKEALP